MRLVAILGLLALAACGADGEPEAPGPKSSGPGIGVSITGKAEVGITG
ncbi:argininosuccinate lyase [Mameliella sediminis]|nr:argininosuccinate lyase [Mameliella sediminis]MBY6114150.1 argininosuccinate lyase [Antarctobacter heliothermus]MBY6142502.1 argininosuccinate lyase [Mameliella alba]MBV7395447.1 argininosuccinate lyase [Mameliella sediminis]MBY6159330.1 argininosuccinate lyase [Mameliella alba]MBY6167801.1 argininosuccinate lyase [Mameliella alba]